MRLQVASQVRPKSVVCYTVGSAFPSLQMKAPRLSGPIPTLQPSVPPSLSATLE